MTDSDAAGVLYVVATPIGNLKDFTFRAVETLAAVDLIAAEDTRHSRHLLDHYGINTPCIAVHEHNERDVASQLLARLQQGENIALVSDAGTPLVSDPGYHLVHLARERQLRVVPIPGVSALITALSVAGLASDRFCFEGFLPAKSGPRRTRLEDLVTETRTLIFYESPHRILSCLQDMLEVFGPEREAVLARELTKLYETVHGDSLGNLLSWLRQDEHRYKGELVLMLAAAKNSPDELDAQGLKYLRLLLKELPASRAAAIVAEMTGLPKKQVYASAMRMRGE